MDPLISSLLVILTFSLIQSLFGVGLLVFGTPTFLLLGLSYPEALSYLLPSSLVLSAMQLVGYRDRIKISRGIYIYALPFVWIGMLFALGIEERDILVLLIGLIMLMIAFFRTYAIEWLGITFKKYGRSFLITTGIVHGLSNQGGALLVVMMSSLYNDKNKIRTNIALSYLLFGLSQMILIILFRPEYFGLENIYFVALTLIVYLLFGRRLFSSISNNYFNSLVPFIVGGYGVVLLAPVLYEYLK